MRKAIILFSAIFMLVSCKEESTKKEIETGKVTDRNGHVYKTVKIGDDWWMAENLRVTVFNDSTPLLAILPSANDNVWASNTVPAFSFVNDTLFGLLYNFSSIEDQRGLAPEGWHIPTDEEWQRMEEAVGMSTEDSDKLGWRGTNEAEKLAPLYSRGWPEFSEMFGTDEFGFNALPGGCRLFNGSLNTQNNTAFWWTRSGYGDNEAWYRYVDYNQDRIFRQHTFQQYGMSIRCVKNK